MNFHRDLSTKATLEDKQMFQFIPELMKKTPWSLVAVGTLASVLTWIQMFHSPIPNDVYASMNWYLFWTLCGGFVVTWLSCGALSLYQKINRVPAVNNFGLVTAVLFFCSFMTMFSLVILEVQSMN